MEKAADQSYYLDAFKRVTAEMLLDEIIPLVAREADSRECRRRWAGEIAFAIVSGVLVKLAKRHPKDVNEFYEQAKRRAKKFALEDLQKHPGENLPGRRDRWIEKLKELPKSEDRRSQKTGQFPLTPLQSLLLHEDVISILGQIYPERELLSESEIVGILRDRFPDLEKKEREEAAGRIANGSPLKEVALFISAWVAGVEVGSFKDHYLKGARKQASAINEALKIR